MFCPSVKWDKTIVNLFIMHGILHGAIFCISLNFFIFGALCFFIRLQPGPLTIQAGDICCHRLFHALNSSSSRRLAHWVEYRFQLFLLSLEKI